MSWHGMTSLMNLSPTHPPRLLTNTKKCRNFSLETLFFLLWTFQKQIFALRAKYLQRMKKAQQFSKQLLMRAQWATTRASSSRKTKLIFMQIFLLWFLDSRLGSTQRSKNENLAQNLNFKWVLQCYIFVCRTDSTKHAVYTSTGIVDSGWWWPVWQLENWHPNFRELSQTIFKIDFFSLTLVVDGWWLSAL